MREAIKEVIYLTNMLKWLNNALNLGLDLKVMPLLTDSDSARKLAENQEFHKRTKHIDIAYHFIRECIRDNKSYSSVYKDLRANSGRPNQRN